MKQNFWYDKRTCSYLLSSVMSHCVGLKPNIKNMLLLADTTTALHNGPT
jgi:hypothetical protein